MKNNQTKKYFAAANSYGGFISYFNNVFNSVDYNRIYVLKGGPGTGKSSLMKKISSLFLNKGFDIEEIYCSSDPKSLDGVIIKSEKCRVAVIDGTSPHERDAIIPGAIDEVINLGDGWDSKWLRAKRNEVLDLAKEKGEAYKTAYAYLKIAGESSAIIKNCYGSRIDKLAIKVLAERLIQNISAENTSNKQLRLFSSFGRYGDYCLDAFEGTDKEIINIHGNRHVTSILIKYCLSKLTNIGIDVIVYPSALDPDLLEAIELVNQPLIIRCAYEGTINSDDLFSIYKTDTERIKKADYLKFEALEEAKRWFSIASDLHFRLEEIYSEAMNFEKNDAIFDRIVTEIDNIS